MPSVRGAEDDDESAADEVDEADKHAAAAKEDFADFEEEDVVVLMSMCEAVESVTGATSTTVMDGAAEAAFGGSHMRTSAGHASCWRLCG